MSLPPTEIRTEPRPNCFLCQCPGKLLYQDVVDSLFNAPGVWNLKQCERPECGLIWLDPTPIEADLPHLYRSYFFSQSSPSPDTRLRLRMRSLLFSAYRAGNYLPSAALGLRKAQGQMHKLFLGDLKPGKLLDIGCGDGTFLNRMQSLGWSVDGLDFDPGAIEAAQMRYGLSLRHGDLAGARFPANVFDAVTMNHVIEHVPAPLALVVEIRRILKPGGRLVVVTPNSLSLGHKRFLSHWVNLDPPRHLHVFTPNALRACAKLAQLDVDRFLTSAANADNFIGASHGVRKFYRNRHHKSASEINIFRALRSLIFQYREAWLLKRDPDVGEEAVLVCRK